MQSEKLIEKQQKQQDKNGQVQMSSRKNKIRLEKIKIK